MPFTELKHIVDGLSGPDGSGIIFEYPVGDDKLQITINDHTTTSDGEKFQSETKILMDVFESSANFDFNYKFTEPGLAC